MELADHNLNELLRRLSGRDRRSVEEAIRGGKKTDESAIILRWLKRRLKRRARKEKRRR